MKNIPTENLIKMAVFQQISATAIGTKFAPPYACIYKDRVEQDFLNIFILTISFLFVLMERKNLKNLWRNLRTLLLILGLLMSPVKKLFHSLTS